METFINKFLKQAEKNPGNVAVLDIQGEYSYDQLNHRSAYLAKKIMEVLTDKDNCVRIALLLPRTKQYLVALLAVLRAGCAAVPIDGEHPPGTCALNS